MSEIARLQLQLDPAFLLDSAPIDAEARGDARRFRDLVRAREDDGLDPSDAELDAAETLGIADALTSAVADAFEPLLSIPDDPDVTVPAWWERGVCEVVVHDTRGNLPTLRRTPAGFVLWLPAGDAGTLSSLTEMLVAVFVDDPDRTVATVETGLGGTGGCACGEDLPEDAPVGPLFAPRPRSVSIVHG